MRRIPLALCLIAGTLAGCSSQTWNKPGADDAAMRADYRECVQIAQPAVERDARIESDIMSTRGDDYRRSGTMMTRRQVSEARTGGRQDDIVDACMHSKGYIRGDEAAATK
ncbi:MAG: hypothetical protein AB7P02_04550 [Alphaproteobacteria bacterium]